MRARLNNHAGFLALTALVVAALGACLAGANAAGVIVGSKQIKKGAILSKHIRANAVKSADLATAAVKSADIGTGAVQSADISDGAVQSTDIGDGQVQPEDVTMPDPLQLVDSGPVSVNPTMQFERLDVIGTYAKEDPASVLEVSWDGSVDGRNGGEASGCVFQLRVDGQPASDGAGQVFGRGVTGVSASALFPGLGAGQHTIEIWARLAAQEPGMGGPYDRCTLGPAAAGISQTIVVAEQVI